MTEKYPPKIFVTGMRGMAGSRFEELNPDLNLVTANRPEFDITDGNKVAETLQSLHPDWIVNFAAFVDVTAAEEQSGERGGTVWQTNVTGPQNLLENFNPQRVIQISTDMVFPGNDTFPGPYSEDDTPPDEEGGLTWYGWTKNRGEKIVRDSGATAIRLIYPVLAHSPKLDYIRSALKRFAGGKMYPLFDDQQISISFLDETAKIIRTIIETESSGVFHVSSDQTTPYQLIEYTLSRLDQDTRGLKSASVRDFLKTSTNSNRYPIATGLKTEITKAKLNFTFLNWREVVNTLIGQGLCVAILDI